VSALAGITDVRRNLRTPLYRNGIALALNSSFSALLGAGYWYVATHHADQATVGQASALVAALMAISAIAQLSLPNLLATFIPRTRERSRRLVLRAYALSTSLGLLLGGAFAVIAPRISHSFHPIAGVEAGVAFALSVSMWTIFALQDNALTGLRRAVWVPFENIVYSGVKLAALAALGAGVGALALFATWVVPAAIAILPVSGILLVRWLPQHARRPGTGEDWAGMGAYFAGDSVGMVLAQLATTTLPVVVAIRLGARASGAFSVPWMLTQSLDLIAINLGMSLVVEGAHDVDRLPGLLRGLRRKTLWLVAGLVAGGIVLAPYLLQVFGPNYAAQGTTVLRLLLLGSLGRAVSVLALCAARARRQTRRILFVQAALTVLIWVGAWSFPALFGLAGMGLAWAVAQGIVGFATFVTEPHETRGARVGAIRTVLLVNHWHDDNKGDSAITGAIVSLVRTCWPAADVRIATLNEAHTRFAGDQLRHIHAAHAVTELPSLAPTEHGSAGRALPGTRVAALRWLVRIAGVLFEIVTGRPRTSTRRRLNDVDLVVMVGGSNVYDNPDVAWPLSLARLVQVLYPAWAAGRMNVPVVMAGHTLGPMPRRAGIRIARHMLKGVDRTVLREQTSVELAERLGAADPAVKPDLAFATVARETAKVRAIVDGLAWPADRTLALVIRQHPHAGGEADRRTLETFAAVARALVDAGRIDGVLVVAQAQGPTEIEDDRPLSLALADRLAGVPVRLVRDDLAADELAALYGSCALVLTVRLHAAILALSQGTPAYAVAYMTRKTEGVMASCGLPYAWCAFDAATPERIGPVAAHLLDPAVTVRLHDHEPRWRADLREEVASWA
jgi:polysaccharide pyruvyl transferase WcaK-like protein/O-antigen/teichoic acid export membrane protein